MLRLRQEDYQAILAHLLSLYPLEGCGLLAGANNLVQRRYPVRNILNSRRAFYMAPEELVAALLDMEEQGWSLLAIYHSHPDGPAAPSPSDIDQAYYPDAAHLIVSLANPSRPTANAFAIKKGKVEKIGLRIE